jgi:hypothetical protein
MRSLSRLAVAASLCIAAFSISGSNGSAQQSASCFLLMQQFQTSNAGVRMLRVSGTFSNMCPNLPPNSFLHMNYQGVPVPGFDFPIQAGVGQNQQFGPVVLTVPPSHPLRGTTPLTFYVVTGAALPNQKTSPCTVEFFTPA